jgi:hypothetical protein
VGTVVKRSEWLEFDRPFAVWAYTVSFSQLLLRSVKDGRPTRVDIGFSGVKAIALQPRYASLVIRPAEDHEVASIRTVLGVEDIDLQECWAVGELTRPGFVIASNVEWHEDQGDFTDASQVFLPAGPFSGLIRDEEWQHS